MKYTATICLVLSAILSAKGQSMAIEPKHTFNIELALPNSTMGKPFKDIMQGLVNVEPYYQYAFKNHIVVGAGLRYTYFTINQFKVPQPVKGGLHAAGAFVKVGWEKFLTERFALDLSVRGGYSQNFYATNRNDTLGINPLQVEAAYIQPTIGLILSADETSSYRLVLGYNIQGYRFNTSMLGLATQGGYSDKDFAKNASFFIIGFGYTHYFKKKN